MSRFANIAFLMVALVVPTAIAQPPPEVPDVIQVPGGHKLLATYEAKGVQVYVAARGKTGDLEWQFEGPLAELSNAKGEKVGIHYYGPAWEAADGSKVYKPKDKMPNSARAKRPTDLDWLLIPVRSDEAKVGTFSNVIFIQRLSTSGGMVPADLPKRAGSKIAVPYTATYYFWSKADLKLRDGKVEATGAFTADDPKYGASLCKKFTVAGEPGHVYSITREGAAYWLYVFDSSGTLITHGWSGEFTPKVTTHHHQPDKKEAFHVILQGYDNPGGDFKLTITARPAPAPGNIALKDGTFQREDRFVDADGVHLGHKQKSYLLNASKNQKFRIEALNANAGNLLIAVKDESGTEMTIRDQKGKALPARLAQEHHVTFEAPAAGTYRIIVANHPYLAKESFVIRVKAE